MTDAQINITKSELLKRIQDERTELLSSFGSALAFNALQSPLEGANQLIEKTCGVGLPHLQICDVQTEKKFASKEWHAQQIGAALGTAIPYLLIRKGVQVAGLENFALTHRLSQSQKELFETATSAAILGGLFRESESTNDRFWSSRFNNACVDTLSFSTLTISNRYLNSIAAQSFSQPLYPAARQVLCSFISGVAAGGMAAESSSLLKSNRFADTEELLKSAYGFAFTGGALSLADVGFQQKNVARRTGSFSDKILLEHLGSADKSELFRNFEQRANANNIAYAAQVETLKQIARLMEPSTETTSVNKALHPKIAREILENIAHPYYIDQGDHPSCVLNSIENLVASNHPDRYAKILADIAITGKSSHDMQLPPKCLFPDKEAQSQIKQDGQRVFASQLFQYYLANLHWSGGGDLPDGNFAEPNSVSYEPIRRGSNTAALYVDGQLFREDGINSRGRFAKISIETPQIEEWQIAPLFKKIIPRGNLTVVDHADSVESTTHEGRKTVTAIKSVRELEKLLLQAAPNSVICGVRAEGLVGQTKVSQDAGWHSVVIRNYDPLSRTLYLDNSWGRAEEFSGRLGEKPRMRIEQLFRIMKPPSGEAA